MRVDFTEDVIIDGRRVRRFDLPDGRTQVVWARGAMCRIRREGERIVAPHFAVEHWGRQVCLVPDTDAATPRAIVQQSVGWSGGETQMTVVREPLYTTVWLDGTESAMWVLPAAEDAAIVQSDALMALAVDLRIDVGHYLFVVSAVDNATLYEGRVERFAMSDRLEVVCTYADMKGHTRTQVFGYREGAFCMLAQTFTCTRAHIYTEDWAPYLFAEALAVGDTEEAKTYLSEELQVRFSDLLRYLGAVRRVCTPPSGAAGPRDVGIVREDGVGRVVHFEMEAGRITDVCLPDDE